MFLHVERVGLDSCHGTQRVELVRNAALPWPAAAGLGLLRGGRVSHLGTHTWLSEAAACRGQRMPPKRAKFLFLTKFLGCTEITLCNTGSCLNA